MLIWISAQWDDISATLSYVSLVHFFSTMISMNVRKPNTKKELWQCEAINIFPRNFIVTQMTSFNAEMYF